MPILDIPTDVLASALCFLAPTDLSASACVSRTFLSAHAKCQHRWRLQAHHLFSTWLPSSVPSNLFLTSSFVRDWAAFVQRRLHHWGARPPPRSALDMVQQRFQLEPLHVLMCCILCSRTSGSARVHSAIETVIATYATPRRLLDACASPVQRGELLRVLHPCGMQEKRLQALERMTTAYLTTDWSTPKSLYGIGEFGVDSYRCFTNNDMPARPAHVSDRNVRAFFVELQRLGYAGGGSSSSSEAGAAAAAAEAAETAVRRERKRQRRQKRKRVASATPPVRQAPAPTGVGLRTRSRAKRSKASPPPKNT